jgi:hypothetical protein
MPPDLSPKTWYGVPAYADAEGKVVVFFQNAGSSTTGATADDSTAGATMALCLMGSSR